MTVCIAAICADGIIGASDRLKTAGDTTFESSQKFFGITDSIAIMTAGDTLLQTKIILELTEHIKNNANTWLVKDIADKYLECRNNLIIKQLNNEVYALWGLDHQTFLEKQNNLCDNMWESIASARNYILQNIPSSAIIITGIDNYGLQLYVIQNDQVACYNQVGFAAIGSGARHAKSQFMLAKYTANTSFSNALLLIHNAKKRSEIAPGVGNNTDMFIIFNSGSTIIDQKIIAELDKIYKETIRKENRMQLSAKVKVDSYIKNIFERNNEKTT